MAKVLCDISKQELDEKEAFKASDLKKELFGFIREEYPGLGENSFISPGSLRELRKGYLAKLIREESEEVGILAAEAKKVMGKHRPLSENFGDAKPKPPTFGEKIADKVAMFGGSWTFIFIFFSFLALWMIVNTLLLNDKSFDPYPYILLNLALSCLAAIQAPIIMMSQNRQEHKDRFRAEQDFKVNLKAELEIKMLHEKVDHLIMNQNRRLLDIQQLQADLLEDIVARIENGKRNDTLRNNEVAGS